MTQTLGFQGRTAVTRSINRRAAMLLAGVAATALLVSGCSAGQIAETARKKPAVPGANVSATLAAGKGSVAVRDALVIYRDDHGYPKGGEAPLALSVFNDTETAVTVTITPRATGASSTDITAGTLTLTAKDSPPIAAGKAVSFDDKTTTGKRPGTKPVVVPVAATASPEPGATTAGAAGDIILTIPAASSVRLSPDAAQSLTAGALADKLLAGMAIPLRFTFSNGLVLDVDAPVGPAATPAPRKTGEKHEAE